MPSAELSPTLFSVPPLRASVGHAHDANPQHRPSMEDALTALRFHTVPALFLGVYDGHGGAQAAALCRSHLHALFLDELLPPCVPLPRKSHPSPLALARDVDSECSTPPYDTDSDDSRGRPEDMPDLVKPAVAFERAYQKMDAILKTRRCCQTGATAVTCFLRRVAGVGRVLTTANCGDARAVLARAGRPLRLSTDHRPVEDKEARRILKSGGFIFANRVSGILNVSRAFGDHCLKSVVISKPDVKEVVLGDMDEFVILACDGLWDFVDEATAVSVAREGFDRGLDSRQVSRLLVREALARKSTDNISVMVLHFEMDDFE